MSQKPLTTTKPCNLVWHRPGRDHICHCTQSHPLTQIPARHHCACGSWISPGSNVTRCSHPSHRFLTRSGTSLCERCERDRQHWHQCQVVGCTNEQPPTANHCGSHSPDELATIRCENCEGQGEADCKEYDCHGEFCEDGYRECPDCMGQGEYTVQVHELTKTPKKSWRSA